MGFSKQYKVLGIMSGTSLDGVDLAFITFHYDKIWQYELGVCQTFAYDKKWLKKLKDLHLKAREYINEVDIEYAEYLSELIDGFIANNRLEIDLICSHGHTVLHEPEKGITLQIGNGKIINKIVEIPVVSDFRILDVELGGQGAPLVPIGDELLFKEYDYCLNLGGFSNFSYSQNEERKAYDICPTNIGLNHYANQLGHDYDKNGVLAESGKLNKQLLKKLNNIEYYKQTPPKSLGKEWLEKKFISIIDQFEDTIENKLNTIAEHAAIQIANCIKEGTCLVTGGGTFNTFLMKRITTHSKAKFTLGDKKLIEYKEALIFGLLGVLNREGEINCLASVTGAKRNSVVGKYFT